MSVWGSNLSYLKHQGIGKTYKISVRNLEAKYGLRFKLDSREIPMQADARNVFFFFFSASGLPLEFI